MAEQVASQYRRLFEVRLLHHYWLDQGAVVFDKLSSDQQNARLLAYEVRSFLKIAPTPTAARSLRGFGCVFRETALGAVVAAPAATTIPASETFEFTVTPVNSDLFDYTSHTFRARQIFNLVSSVDGRTYRYKEDVPVLSNLTGATRGTGPNLQLFLSREIPALVPSAPVESLVTDSGALLQFTSDGPSATTQQIGTPATDFPVYVHQNDAPLIVAPAGVVGTPARGVLLTSELPDDVFTVIRLTAIRTDDAAFSFVDGLGMPKAAHPVYQVRFKNRLTVWVYRDQHTGAVSSIEPNALPLTFFGNAGTKQKPSRGHVKAERTGSKVDRLVSEIHV